jgi:hypothetical protein
MIFGAACKHFNVDVLVSVQSFHEHSGMHFGTADNVTTIPLDDYGHLEQGLVFHLGAYPLIKDRI